jgi:hypothetical protein
VIRWIVVRTLRTAICAVLEWVMESLLLMIQARDLKVPSKYS